MVQCKTDESISIISYNSNDQCQCLDERSHVVSVIPTIKPQADKNGLQLKRSGEEGMMKEVENIGEC